MTSFTTTRSATALGLHHEIRGTGPAVLLIAGATGDAGHFSRAADRLADEFTIITYDRRGNSRSVPASDPQTAATIAAQADDAAALIRSCGFEQGTVVGTSGGAIITLDLLARHPEVVRAAVVHEPPLFSLLAAPEGPHPLQPIFDLAVHDKRAALEAFVRDAATDSGWEAIDGATRDRMFGNATTLFDFEVGRFMSYQLDDAALKAFDKPVTVVNSTHGLPFSPAVQGSLAQRYGWNSTTISGHHAPYLDTPEVFAEELRPILRHMD